MPNSLNKKSSSPLPFRYSCECKYLDDSEDLLYLFCINAFDQPASMKKTFNGSVCYHHDSTTTPKAKDQRPNFLALNLAEANTLGRKKIRKSLNRFFSLEASMPKNGRWLQKWVPFLNGFFYVRTLRHFFIWRTTLGGGDGDFWRRTSRPLCLLLWRKRLKGWRQDICP